MVTETMTWKEAHDEIVSDYIESNVEARWSVHFRAQMRHYIEAVNRGKEKVLKPIVYRSKRLNTFYIVPYVTFIGGRFQVYHETLVLARCQKHLWIAPVRYCNDQLSTCFYSHHLFCRYEERFNLNDEIPESFMKTVTEFFRRNVNHYSREFERDDHRELFMIFDEGFALGKIIDEVHICQTYIRFDMMHEDQKNLYLSMLETFELQKTKWNLYNPAEHTAHGRFVPRK